MMSDRAGISKENDHIERDGTIRLYFTLEEAKSHIVIEGNTVYHVRSGVDRKHFCFL